MSSTKETLHSCKLFLLYFQCETSSLQGINVTTIEQKLKVCLIWRWRSLNAAMEVTNTVTVTKHYEKCLNMLLHAVLLYFGGHMIRATGNPITTVVCLSSQNIVHDYFKNTF